MYRLTREGGLEAQATWPTPVVVPWDWGGRARREPQPNCPIPWLFRPGTRLHCMARIRLLMEPLKLP